MWDSSTDESDTESDEGRQKLTRSFSTIVRSDEYLLQELKLLDQNGDIDRDAGGKDASLLVEGVVSESDGSSDDLPGELPQPG